MSLSRHGFLLLFTVDNRGQNILNYTFILDLFEFVTLDELINTHLHKHQPSVYTVKK